MLRPLLLVALLAATSSGHAWVTYDNGTSGLFDGPSMMQSVLLEPSSFRLPAFSEWSSRQFTTDGGGSPPPQAQDRRGQTHERFNYASIDCSAKVLSASKEAQWPTAIQDEDRDRYMLMPCNIEPKYVVLELCDSIRIDTVVLGNHELFSGVFREFSLWAADTQPVVSSTDGWTLLGRFSAENVRVDQIFPVESPKLWARFVRLEIHSHYNNEHYCPLTRMRVHGVTMMQAFQETRYPSKSSLASLAAKPSPATLPPTAAPENAMPTAADNIDEFYIEYFGRSKDISEIARVGEDDVWQPDASEENIFTSIVHRIDRLELNATLTSIYLDKHRVALNDALNGLKREVNKRGDAMLAAQQKRLKAQIEALAAREEQSSNEIKELQQLVRQQQEHIIGFGLVIVVCTLLLVVSLVARGTFVKSSSTLRVSASKQ